MDHKNEDISESVNSIDSGANFRSRLAHELSRNISVVSVYALLKKLCGRIGFLMTPKKMTRRAFVSSRVIQAQRKSSSRRLVKKWCKWITNMKIFQNL